LLPLLHQRPGKKERKGDDEGDEFDEGDVKNDDDEDDDEDVDENGDDDDGDEEEEEGALAAVIGALLRGALGPQRENFGRALALVSGAPAEAAQQALTALIAALLPRLPLK